MLSEYLDRGGNFIDTANIYTSGHSEKILGDYFAARPSITTRAVASSAAAMRAICQGAMPTTTVEILSGFQSAGISGPVPVELPAAHRRAGAALP